MRTVAINKIASFAVPLFGEVYCEFLISALGTFEADFYIASFPKNDLFETVTSDFT